MSKELKIILIVFGSLAALVVIALVGAGVFFVTAISRNVGSSTPQSQAHDAAKIATFTLPRGYHYMMAMDMAVMNMVAVAPVSASSRGFIIELQGIEIPTGAETDDQLMASMQQSLGTGQRCSGATSVGTDSIVTASRKTVDLREIVCQSASSSASPTDKMIEFGRIPSKYPLAMLMAIGTRRDFDRNAVHALVQSIR